MRCKTIKREIAFDLITPHTIERTTVFPIWELSHLSKSNYSLKLREWTTKRCLIDWIYHTKVERTFCEYGAKLWHAETDSSENGNRNRSRQPWWRLSHITQSRWRHQSHLLQMELGRPKEEPDSTECSHL